MVLVCIDKDTINECNNMKKKTIRLTESEFKSLITESVKKIIQEGWYTPTPPWVNDELKSKGVYLPLAIKWNLILDRVANKINETFDMKELFDSDDYFEEYNESEMLYYFIDNLWDILPPDNSEKETIVNFLVLLDDDEYGERVQFLGKVNFQDEENIDDAILDAEGPYYAEELLRIFKDCFEKDPQWTQELIENNIVYRRIGNNVRVCTKTHPNLKINR